MGIPQLLSKFSPRAPRFVTIEGQIIPDGGVIATNDGFRHHVHGWVTEVEPHHFHGGEDTRYNDSGAAAADPWWTSNPDLLETERRHMADAFPAFKENNVHGHPSWRGPINTGRGLFDVRVIHRPGHGLPDVQVIRPHRLIRNEGRRARRSPHLYDSGNLCVARQEDWQGDQHDAVTVVAWTAHWLAAYTQWRMSGAWPTRGFVPTS